MRSRFEGPGNRRVFDVGVAASGVAPAAGLDSGLRRNDGGEGDSDNPGEGDRDASGEGDRQSSGHEETDGLGLRHGTGPPGAPSCPAPSDGTGGTAGDTNR